MSRRKSDGQAYTDALTDLVDVLTKAGHPYPHDAATGFLRRLLDAGWGVRRPVYDPEPPPGRPAPPEAVPDYLAAREQLRHHHTEETA